MSGLVRVWKDRGLSVKDRVKDRGLSVKDRGLSVNTKSRDLVKLLVLVDYSDKVNW